jgi:hypothetical protein
MEVHFTIKLGALFKELDKKSITNMCKVTLVI